jgi:hypothetical protein
MSERDALEEAIRAIVEFKDKAAKVNGEAIDLVTKEKQVQELLHSLGREMMVEIFEEANETAPEVLINGQRWGNRRSSKARYETLFGEIAVERGIYQQAGKGRCMVPMDLRLGIVEGRYTPTVTRVMTRAVASMPEAEAHQLLEEVGVVRVSESTLHRVPRAMAARYELQRPIIEAAVREQEDVPEAAATVQVALDGVMVPMDGEHANRRGRKTDSPKAPRHETRYGPGPPDPSFEDDKEGRAWHEASVGTLAYWDAAGEHLRTVYVGRMPESLKVTLAAHLEQELVAALQERPELNVSFASDGAVSHWDALGAMESRLPAEACGTRMFLLDKYHLGSYLATAAKTIAGEGTPEAELLWQQWSDTMRLFPDGTARVLKMLRYYRDKQTTTRAQAEALDGVIEFIANQARHGRTNYAEALENNFPIGTGVTEAAAKTLVNVRMKRAGARFNQHGGQTILTFRSAALSGRFHSLSRQLEQTYTADVRLAA